VTIDDVDGCLACDLTAGRRPLPGGRVHETRRHVVSLGDLRDDEAAELGPLLVRTAAVVDELVRPEQVYVGLWSHAGRTRVHVHFVVQPATTEAIDAVGAYGPTLVAGMFDRAEPPDPAAVEGLCDRARVAFAR